VAGRCGGRKHRDASGSAQRGGVRGGRQHATELAARGDVELNEDVAQLVLDRARGQEPSPKPSGWAAPHPGGASSWLLRYRRRLQRPHRGGQPHYRENPAARPRFPQLPAPPLAPVRRNPLEGPHNATGQNLPSTFGGAEPVYSAAQRQRVKGCNTTGRGVVAIHPGSAVASERFVELRQVRDAAAVAGACT
jgi:hypothetical protein